MRNSWVRPGTLAIGLGLVWAFSVTLFFLSSPITTANGTSETIVEAGGFPAFFLILAPIVLCAVPLFLRTSPLRTRVVLVGAVLLTALAVLAPTSLGFYLVSAVALWIAYRSVRRDELRTLGPRADRP